MGLKIHAGDKAEFFLFLKNKNGDPVDLSNVTEIKYAWKNDPKDQTSVFVKSGDGNASPITIVGDPVADGKIKINLEPTDTDQTPKCYASAAQILDENSKPLTVTFDEDNLTVEILPKQF